MGSLLFWCLLVMCLKNIWVLNEPWSVFYSGVCWSWVKELGNPQCVMGLSVDVVIVGHILFKYMSDLKAP